MSFLVPTKLLVVSSLSEVKKREMKRLTGSAVADEVKTVKRDYNGCANQLFRSVQKGLALTLSNKWLRDMKIYQLDNNAYSTMYALKDNEFLAALTLDDSTIKRLDWLIDAEAEIESIKSFALHILNNQERLNSGSLSKLNIAISNQAEYTSMLKNINEKYGEQEYQLILDEITSIIKSSW